jgi:CheY-like chemotaxis protein
LSVDIRKTVVEVRYNPGGWWDVCVGREVVSRCVSEFQAWETGRLAAQDRCTDLLMHQLEGPVKYETYDEATDTVGPAPAGAPSPEPPEPRRALILLVEAAFDVRELWAEYLTYSGFGVVTAINGHEAIRLARVLSPDLIVMALRMPGMDGLQATTHLKRDPSLAHIPVVAVGADMSHEVSERARLAGCSAFITSATMPNQVADEITRVLAVPRQG